VIYIGRIGSASSGLSEGNCVVTATADGFEPLAAIEFNLWGEGGPDPDGTIATIPTTTDSTGSASIQHTVDPHAHSQIAITAMQPLSSAQTTIALNCPDPTPVPPKVVVTMATSPDEPDFCLATATLSGFSPSSSFLIEFYVLGGTMDLWSDLVETDVTGSAAYILPVIIAAVDYEDVEARVVDPNTSTTISSGVQPIAC
jgi:hypothetical protein